MAKINALYAKLDEDGSGGLCYEELREGLKMSLGLPIALTREDFETITENGRFVTDSEFDSEQFQQMMRAELWRFSRRALNNVLSVTGDDQVSSPPPSPLLVLSLSRSSLAQRQTLSLLPPSLSLSSLSLSLSLSTSHSSSHFFFFSFLSAFFTDGRKG